MLCNNLLNSIFCLQIEKYVLHILEPGDDDGIDYISRLSSEEHDYAKQYVTMVPLSKFL